MDLSKQERHDAAEISFRVVKVTDRDKQLIANVIQNSREVGSMFLASLGAVCPYYSNQQRERAAWCAEIDRQMAEAGRDIWKVPAWILERAA